MRCIIAMGAAMFAVVAPCHAQTATSKVIISRIDDSRVYVASGVPQPMFPGKHAGLNITLQVSGRTAGNAASFGRLSISAVDNLGGALRLLSASVGGQPIDAGDKAMHEIHRDAIGRPAPPKWFDISLHVAEPPRKANALVVLKGSFQLIAGGRNAVVPVNPIKSLGKYILSPVLKRAGLDVRVLKSVPAGAYAPGPASRFLILAVRGNKTAMQKVKTEDSFGGGIGKGLRFTSVMKHTMVACYQLKRPFKAGDKVELIVATGQKTIKVPFDFHNIKLP
ncbi:MAG: hypothetical protein ACYCUV_05915 [Phycisphaerae bacterium]